VAFARGGELRRRSPLRANVVGDTGLPTEARIETSRREADEKAGLGGRKPEVVSLGVSGA